MGKYAGVCEDLAALIWASCRTPQPDTERAFTGHDCRLIYDIPENSIPAVQCSRSRRPPNSPPSARAWPPIPSSPSIPNSCARPPIIRCCAWRRWRGRRGSGDRRAGAGHRSGAVLRADGEREGDEGVSCRAAGHRNRLARGEARSASDLRYARSPPWCSATAIPSPTTSWCQRITGDTLDKSHRFTDWTRRPLVGCAAALRRFRRDASARRLSGAGRRSRAPRPRRLGRGRDGGADLARHLPHGSGQRLAAAEDARAQAEGACRADRRRRLARARGADARRAARARPQGRSHRRHRRAGADHARASSSGCARCPRVSSARAGARPSSPRSSAGWRAIRRPCRIRPRAPAGAERRRHRRTPESAAAHDLGAAITSPPR